MTSLNKNEFLNSNNFLNFSDTFYGAYIQHEDLHKFDKNNYRVLLDENGSCLINPSLCVFGIIFKGALRSL